MKEPNELEKIDKEERTIFIILSIILLIAIGIIVTWYFTKNKYDSDVPKKETEIKQDKKDEEEDTSDNVLKPIKENIVVKPINVEKEPDVIEPEVVDEKPIIIVPTNLSGMVFKNDNIYEIPKASAKDSSGKDYNVVTKIQYRNQSNELLDIDLEDNQQLIIPSDALELIFTFVVVDKNGDEITEIIKVPVKKIYSVTFKNIEEEFEIEVEANNKIATPANFEEFDTKITTDEEVELSFGGWYTDEDYTESFDFDTNVNYPITLYAKWGFIVEYYEETEFISKEVVEANKEANYIETEKEGYEFVWYVEDEEGLVLFTEETITSDVKLIGRWIEITPGKIEIIDTEDENIDVNVEDNNINIEIKEDVEFNENNAQLLFTIRPVENATHYRKNDEEKIIEITEDEIKDEIIIAKEIEEEYVNVIADETRKYYWYEDTELIAITEVEINITEASN